VTFEKERPVARSKTAEPVKKKYDSDHDSFDQKKKTRTRGRKLDSESDKSEGKMPSLKVPTITRKRNFSESSNESTSKRKGGLKRAQP